MPRSMCLAEGTPCSAPGARLPCCRDTDPLQNLQCVPGGAGAAGRVCAGPPTAGAVTAAAVGSRQVRVQMAAPASTGGSTAGARYEARLSEVVPPGRPARGPYLSTGAFAGGFAPVSGGWLAGGCCPRGCA